MPDALERLRNRRLNAVVYVTTVDPNWDTGLRSNGIDAPGAVETFQLELTAIDERELAAEQQIADGPRDQDLVRFGASVYLCRDVDGHPADVPVVQCLDDAGVHAGAHRQVPLGHLGDEIDG